MVVAAAAVVVVCACVWHYTPPHLHLPQPRPTAQLLASMLCLVAAPLWTVLAWCFPSRSAELARDSSVT